MIGDVPRSCGVTWRWRSGRVVPELAEHPGAEDDTESWLGAVDVGVRVLLKNVAQLLYERGDLPVEFGDDRDRRGG